MPQNLRDLFIQGVVVILLKHVSLTYNIFVLFDRVNEEVIGVIFYYYYYFGVSGSVSA